MALTDTFIRQVKHTGKPAGDKYTDGQGMLLWVNRAGKYWRFNYRFDGKQRTLALGVYPDVSLAQARTRRDDARKLVANQIDPNDAKRAAKNKKASESRNTFEAVAKDWLKKSSANRASNTANKINRWLEKDVFPQIGSMPISNIKPIDVLKATQKIEARGAIESAHRVKQICGQIFRFAVANGIAERDVTTDLKSALTTIPKQHYAAITDPKELGGLLRSIYGYQGHPYAITALKLAPLLFVRPGMLRSMEWKEIDFETAEWRIPANKMKMRIDHIVPLAAQSLALLKELYPLTGDGVYVFPSIRTAERCMSENTINAALRSMGYDNKTVTGHGFRATARTILDEVLGERPDFIEHQLAHAVKDPNGRAYNRTAHLPARKEMMQRWADFLDKLRIGADILPFRSQCA